MVAGRLEVSLSAAAGDLEQFVDEAARQRLGAALYWRVAVQVVAAVRSGVAALVFQLVEQLDQVPLERVGPPWPWAR